MLSKVSIFQTKDQLSFLIIRILVGCVFVSEGIQKFLFPESVGSGRFLKIGIPFPEFTANFVGTVEIACGLLVLMGLLTKLAVIPLIVIMLTAIATTKIPIFMESGFWKMAHDSRTDFAMLLSCLFLLINGAGKPSLDLFILRRNFNDRSQVRPEFASIR